MASQDSVIKAIMLLQVANPRNGPQTEELTAATVQLWVMLLGSVPDLSLEAAVVAHLTGPKAHMWPQPGNLIALIPSQRAAPDDAEDAWEELLRTVRGVAMLILYPNQGERYTHAALRLSGGFERCKAQLAWLDSKGGPRTLVQMNDRGIDFARSDFLRSYRARMGQAAQRATDRKVLALVRPSAPQIGGDS